MSLHETVIEDKEENSGNSITDQDWFMIFYLSLVIFFSLAPLIMFCIWIVRYLISEREWEAEEARMELLRFGIHNSFAVMPNISPLISVRAQPDPPAVGGNQGTLNAAEMLPDQ